MKATPETQTFRSTLHAAVTQPGEAPWGFVILPKEISQTLPRRGRTTVQGTLNGHAFQAMLEPDGQLSHWLKVNPDLMGQSSCTFGDAVTLSITPVAQEPDPDIPPDFRAALNATPEALEVWQATTTLARVDWIHWITSAKQPRTRSKRIADACDMLASGKRRVCCFDPSGYYSRAFSAPEASRFANEQ
ncbi:MAG: YdeI/OmpD-associated family protein [Puniceicoccaceae bacterium]